MIAEGRARPYHGERRRRCLGYPDGQWTRTRQQSQRPTGCTIIDFNALIELGCKFGCVYADPPWLYANQGTYAATSNHYEEMTVADDERLPLGRALLGAPRPIARLVRQHPSRDLQMAQDGFGHGVRSGLCPWYPACVARTRAAPTLP